MTDTFTVYFNHLEKVALGTQCGEIQKGVVIKNGSTIAIPLQCTAIADRVLYMRAVELRTETKHETGTNMLDRQAMHPLHTVMIHENDVEKSLNETIKLWNEKYAEIQSDQDLKHAKLHHGSEWSTMTLIFVIVGGILIPIILIMAVNQIRQCCSKVISLPSAPAPVEQRVFSQADCMTVVDMLQRQNSIGYPSRHWNQGGQRFSKLPRESFQMMPQPKVAEALQQPEGAARFSIN